MNLFNRVVVAFLLLALAAGAISIVVLAWAIPEDSIAGLGDAVEWLDDNNEDLQKVVLTTAGALIALIALTVLVFEFVPAAGPDVKVADVTAANAVLSTAAIAQRVEEAVREVPSVGEVKAVVKSRRKGVEVALDLHVEPDANLASVAEQASEATRRALADRLHVALADRPRVRLHYRELRLQSQQRPAAAVDQPREEEPTPPGEPSPPAETPPPPSDNLIAQNGA